jgi:clan AA aspartic protease
MVSGSVNAFKQAIVVLELRGPNGHTENVEVVIDTGFDDFFTVSPDLQTRLQMPFREIRSYELGDGNLVNFPIHQVTVVWDGQDRDVEALVTDGGVLLGMSMLTGYTLFIDAIDGGEVRIARRA